MISPIGNFWQSFEPAADIGLAEWCVRHVFNEEGKPFDYLQFPHMVAPGGPMDHFDASWIRELVMQWASRLGKTFIILNGSLYLVDIAPCNQILAGNSEQLGMQQTERVRQMGEQIPHMAESFLRTQKRRLRVGGSTIYAAWAKSPVTLSNINAMFGGASELDLWEQSTTSKHPDPEEMFGDRFKNEDVQRKEIYESIPTLDGTYIDDRNGTEIERPRSRIAARRERGSDCRLYAGCVYCYGRQVLTDERIAADGYRCEHCDKIIGDEHRKEFIRSGVWVPRGCAADPELAWLAAAERLDDLGRASELPEGDPQLQGIRDRMRWRGWKECGYLIEPPEVDGPVWSSQLSSFYALSLTWGRLAAAKSPSQNYVNQWAGELMHVEELEEIDVPLEARKLAAAITSDMLRGELPDWAEYVVFTSDRQMRSFPWQITAWNAAVDRVHIVDCGSVPNESELEEIAGRKSSGRHVGIALQDCGHKEQDVYDFCLRQTQKQPFRFWPLKGDKASVVKLNYIENRIKDELGRKSPYRKLRRVHVNSQSTQEWVVTLLEQRDAITLFHEAPGNHQWLCEELLNEQEEVKVADSRWERIDRAIPNDQRDCLRYGKVGALILKKHAKPQQRTMAAPEAATESTKRPRMVGPSTRPRLTQ